MENATKALLIAASVLIVIVLIAVGIKILSSTSGVANQVDEVSQTMEMSVFNSQFTDYEGTQTGTQVKALLNKVATTYRSGSSRQVKVRVNNGDGLTSGMYDTAKEISTLRSKVKINSTYNVVASIGSDGYVVRYYYFKTLRGRWYLWKMRQTLC